MATIASVCVYRSDYTGGLRYALVVDGRYPPEHDYATPERALEEQARILGNIETANKEYEIGRLAGVPR
jgi:hypothetical protein